MEIFNLFVEVPYAQGARKQMLLCAVGSPGLNAPVAVLPCPGQAAAPRARGAPNLRDWEGRPGSTSMEFSIGILLKIV